MWSTECQIAFENIKAILTDYSDIGIGTVLAQKILVLTNRYLIF